MQIFISILIGLIVLMLLFRTIFRLSGKYKGYLIKDGLLQLIGPYSFLGIATSVKLEDIVDMRIIGWGGLLKVKGIFCVFPILLTKKFVVIEKKTGIYKSLVVGSNYPERMIEDIKMGQKSSEIK